MTLLMLIYIIAQYVLLAVFLFSCWGLGRGALRVLRLDCPEVPRGLLDGLALACGLGVAACILQGLAIIGLLKVGAVVAFGLVGLVLAAQVLLLGRVSVQPAPGGFAGIVWRKPGRQMLCAWSWPQRLAFALMLLVGLPTLFAPLAPPLEWDELMYHLPHARQWASSGSLTVNEWLRYPWFPYNFDLLFSVPLLFGNDVLPHLLHAAAGWIVAWLVLEWGSHHVDRLAGCLAAACWLYLSRDEYIRAYVDMGVTLWLLAGSMAFWQGWKSEPQKSCAWWMLAAFLIGSAAGAKYQVLGVMPFFVIALAWRERRVKTWLAVALAFALPCAYWYMRNAILTGDPVAPLGGKIFGFTDWNLQDYQAQFEDLRRNVGWPSPLLWAAPLAFVATAVRRNKALVAAGGLVLYQVVVWCITSRYPRYLLPAYPLLALLAVQGWRGLAQQVRGLVPSVLGQWWLQRTMLVILGVFFCFASVLMAYKKARLIAPTAIERETVLQARIPGYGVIDYLRAYPVGKLYQLGMEDAIYYLPAPVWGEVFGPWRSRDYAYLNPAALQKKLLDGGFSSLLIHTDRFSSVASAPDFDQYFEPLASDGPVVLYRILPISPS